MSAAIEADIIRECHRSIEMHNWRKDLKTC